MKIIFRILLITILAFSPLKANCVVMSASEVKEIITQQVLSDYKNYTDAELSVEVVTLPFKDLSLPNGYVTFQIESPVKKFMPRDLEKVSVFVNGKFIKTFNAPIVVKAWEDVLVATSFINIGQEIRPSVATVKRVEVSNTLGYQLKADALNKEIMARKAFREGEVIDKRFVKLKPEVIRNANVMVLFNKDNLTVSTEASALSDGTVGDSICLINRKYNKVYTGRVIGENKVLVKL